MQVASFVVAMFAVLIALVAFAVPLWLDHRRRNYPLTLIARAVTTALAEDGTLFVLLAAAACNTAHAPKIIYSFEIPCPDGYKIDEFRLEHDIEKGLSQFRVEGYPRLDVRSADIGLLPFDVEPLRSRRFLLPLKLSVLQGEDCGGIPSKAHQTIRVLQVIARDEKERVLAHATVNLDTPQHEPNP